MKLSQTGASSNWLAFARICVGIMFLIFDEYKLVHSDFAHGGYASYVQQWVDTSAPHFYQPFLKFTIRHQVFFAYATGVLEALVGISMVIGWWVRTFSMIGALFVLNLVIATWGHPPGTPYWMYLGRELEHIPLILLFLIFTAHRAGTTWGLDR